MSYLDDPCLIPLFPMQHPLIGSPPNPGSKAIKSFVAANGWSKDELLYFRIYDTIVSMEDFFMLPRDALRDPVFIDPRYSEFYNQDVLQHSHAHNAAEQLIKGLMDALRGVHIWTVTPMGARNPNESITDQLVEKLLSLVGYDDNAIVRRNQPVPLFMCGEQRNVNVDIAVMNDAFTSYVLFCVEDKRAERGQHPFPQLMAYAIAAFQYNNLWRASQNYPTLNSMVCVNDTVILITYSYNTSALDFPRCNILWLSPNLLSDPR